MGRMIIPMNNDLSKDPNSVFNTIIPLAEQVGRLPVLFQGLLASNNRFNFSKPLRIPAHLFPEIETMGMRNTAANVRNCIETLKNEIYTFAISLNDDQRTVLAATARHIYTDAAISNPIRGYFDFDGTFISSENAQSVPMASGINATVNTASIIPVQIQPEVNIAIEEAHQKIFALQQGLSSAKKDHKELTMENRQLREKLIQLERCKMEFSSLEDNMVKKDKVHRAVGIENGVLKRKVERCQAYAKYLEEALGQAGVPLPGMDRDLPVYTGYGTAEGIQLPKISDYDGSETDEEIENDPAFGEEFRDDGEETLSNDTQMIAAEIEEAMAYVHVETK